MPLATYHVSGEFSDGQGRRHSGLDRRSSGRARAAHRAQRAGADFILTYFAAEMAEALGG